MPLPMWAASLGVQALQDPAIQRGIYNVGSGVLGGAARGADYLARGAGGLAQEAGGGLADILGGLGERVLPERAMNIGRGIRGGIGRIGSGIGGLYNAVIGDNQPQMGNMVQMPMMGQGMMGGMGGMGQMNPERMMQQRYMQQIQQPYQFNYGNQRQQLLNQYNQELLPQLANRFGGAGALSSGAFRRASTGALGNLQTNLGALEEQGRMQEAQMNQQRLGNIGQYLTQQQQLGLGARRLGQEGTIAARQDALRQMGLMGGFAQQQQQDYMNQLVNAINAQGGMGNIGIGAPFSPIMTQGGPSGMSQLFGAALPFMAQGAGRAMGLNF